MVFVTVELQSALVITAGTVALFAFYYDASMDEFLEALVVTCALTAIAIGSVPRTYRRLRPVRRWIGGARGPEDTARAWSAAVGLPLDLLRRDLPIPLLFTVVPSCALGVVLLGLPWPAFFPFLIGAAVAVGYAAILHFLAIEAGMRPILIDINRSVSPRLRQQQLSVLLLRAADGHPAADQRDHRARRRGADLGRRRAVEHQRRCARRRGGGDGGLARADDLALEIDPAADRGPPAGDRGRERGSL